MRKKLPICLDNQSSWQGVPENWHEFHGFVYQITNNVTGRWYIGKKYFWASRKATKKDGGKKILKESDWREYCGSSRELLEDIERYGIKMFDKIMLGCYKQKWLCSYFEAKKQIERDCLFDKNSYNCIINLRVSVKKH